MFIDDVGCVFVLNKAKSVLVDVVEPAEILPTQLPAVSQAELAALEDHSLILANGTISPVERMVAIKLFVPLLNTICESCWAVNPVDAEPT